nr:HAMP domain-containing sensor histidine kinase [Aquabacterium terrae]
MTATDMAAFVLAVLAVLYGAMWVRDREPGMPWLCVSFALAAVWYAGSEQHLPTGAYIVEPAQRATAAVILLSTMTMTIGLVRYLGRLTRLRRAVLALLLLPGALVLVGYMGGVPVLRSVSNAAAVLGYAGCALMAFRAARREPGAGHGIIGIAVLMIPVILALLVALKADLRMLRYLGVLPVLFFGLTLLTVSLLRRRRALEAEVRRRALAEAELMQLNATLEQRVAERTFDLAQLVGGLESFNRSISHDLRGPLGGIEGLARLAHEALEDKGDVSVARRVLPAIAAQAETSTRLVGALLDLARVGDIVLQRRRFSLDTIVREVIEQLAAAQPTQALPAIELGTLPQVDGDPDLLRPVLTNLISNAIKFSREQPAPRIEVTAELRGGEHVVRVADNGAGFDSSAAQQIFEPFRRLHGRRFEGTGVGLSIVRRAVERHGGRVWAQAAPGQGATFYFSLPLAA